jgi:hypothetical protein
VPDDLLILTEVQILEEQEESSILQEVVSEVVIVSAAEQGPPGPAGVSSNASFSHTQSAASDTWTVNHNLGFRPAASILSVGGKEMWAEVIHTSNNQFLAYFDAPVAGVAICS